MSVDVLERRVFCVSDHTGLTAETLAHSLMSRFDVEAGYRTLPFVDTEEKVRAVVAEIAAAAATGPRPIVFSTLTDAGLSAILAGADAIVLGLFDVFVGRLTDELGVAPSASVGRFHGIRDTAAYQLRLDAVDFALTTDDGLGTDRYDMADVVVVGVSRVGKTPTCLYLSMHYGIRAANYPLTVEDLDEPHLPASLRAYPTRLYGLTIDPVRLHQIRQKRRPDSPYASLPRCQEEVAAAERLFRAHDVPVLDTTARSIEELAATMIDTAALPRRLD